MKSIRTLLFALIIFFTAINSSFALFDASAYGSYTYAGSIEQSGENPDQSGFGYGFDAHYNWSIAWILRAGIGPYIEYNDLTIDKSGNDLDYSRKTVGADFYLQLDPPLIPLHPYVTLSAAIWDHYSGDVSDTIYFRSYAYGAGLAITFFPLLQIYGEYLYNSSDIDGSNSVCHRINTGLRISF